MENNNSRKEFNNTSENININETNYNNYSDSEKDSNSIYRNELQNKSIIDLESMKTTYEKNIILRREKLDELIRISLEKNDGKLLNKKTGMNIPLTEALQKQLIEQNEKNIYEEFGKKLEIVNDVLAEKVKQNIDEINKEIRCINMSLNRIMAGNIIKQYDFMKAQYLTDRLKAKQAQIRILQSLNKNYYKYYVTEDKITKEKRAYIAAEKAYEKQQMFYNPYAYTKKQKKIVIPDLKEDNNTTTNNKANKNINNDKKDKYKVVVRSGFVNLSLGRGISRYKFETNRAKAIQMIYDEISTNAIDDQAIFTKDDAERLIDGLDVKAVDPNIVLAMIKYEKERVNLHNVNAFEEYTNLRRRILKDISNYYMQVKSKKQSDKLKILYDLKASNNLVDAKYMPIKEQAFRSRAFATIRTGFLDRVFWFFKQESKTEKTEKRFPVHYVKDNTSDYYLKGSNRIRVRNTYDSEETIRENIEIQREEEARRREEEERILEEEFIRQQEEIRMRKQREKYEFEQAKADVVAEAYKVKKNRADGYLYDDRV